MEIFEYGERELDYLRRRDKRLAEAINRIGMIEREVIPDPFAALINCVVCQQISSQAATTVWRKMQGRFEPIMPQTMARSSIEELQKCGLSSRKAGYIKGIGTAAVQGQLNLAKLRQLPDEDIVRLVSSLDGVGRWTAEMLLIFSMQRPDVVSWSDLGIRRGMMTLYGLDELGRDRFERYRKQYSPYGSVASLYLWAVAKER
ncbi:MAG: 3-methyl-adenine DNA glycosylase II [Methanosaeta sp. PtaB.Bin039]|nr:MAG: 3-methyl-adenine DNA glycosylase II [Methanosaeta sp. PtaB.Bin039]OPY47130.1 MAG: 3-methyl-adenine DNA glycosylase II [Methanosaeta sp. PtaU1.Bin028]HOT07807.1 hypothetical protein [Methanotrichaceae archaeon]HQF16411.1 hypothetical protein [Methanotrichaceae archaeon]HQI90975.1 hypothetical protein [Methanotrichaceae archaeon]